MFFVTCLKIGKKNIYIFIKSNFMLQKLHEIISQSNLLYPEICLAILVILQILLAAFSVSYRVCLWVFIVGMVLTMGLISFTSFNIATNTNENLDNTTTIILISLSHKRLIFKYLFAICAFLTAILSAKEKDQRKDGVFLALLATIVLGMNLAISTENLLLLYIAIEVVSISSYLLIIFNKSYKSSEAAIKYFLFGATASGIMLYGISLLYGFGGSIEISTILNNFVDTTRQIPSLPFYFACLLTLVGILFKMAVVPLHTWVSDVYEGATTSFVAFLTTSSKILGFAILYFILQNFAIHKIPTQNMMAIIAILSLLFGTLGAIWQQNIKRLLAYSSVSHSGFLLSLFAIIGYQDIFSTMIFYLFSYLLLSYLAFYSILLVENYTNNTKIEAFAGLGKSQNGLGIIILLAFIGLAGLPPSSGFTAKLLIFTNLLNAYQPDNQVLMIPLITIMIITTLIALYFYLKIPYYLFFKQNDNAIKITLTLLDKCTLTLLEIGIIVLFLKPNILEYLF
jgi:NADH-quinone oxidoreductase subunit N